MTAATSAVHCSLHKAFVEPLHPLCVGRLSYLHAAVATRSRNRPPHLATPLSHCISPFHVPPLQMTTWLYAQAPQVSLCVERERPSLTAGGNRRVDLPTREALDCHIHHLVDQRSKHSRRVGCSFTSSSHCCSAMLCMAALQQSSHFQDAPRSDSLTQSKSHNSITQQSHFSDLPVDVQADSIYYARDCSSEAISTVESEH